VFPTTSDEVVLKNEEASLRSAVSDVMTQLHGQEAAARQADFLRRLLRVQRCTNLEVDAATSLVGEAEEYSVLIFLDAAKYRQKGLVIDGPANGSLTMISEDLWVPHVHSFAERSVAAAGKKSCYVVLDVGETSPYKPRNAEILRDVADCGVLGSRIVDDPREMVVARLDGWAQQIQAGLLGAAFSGIDGLPPSLNSEKRLLKIQLLSRAGLSAHMLEFLHQEVQVITEIDPEVLVQFARYAETAGDSELASQFLAPAIAVLASQEYLELASLVCSDIDNTVLEDACLRRLETLFPNSHHPHQRRFTNLIDSRRYLEAAAMCI
jgi:hypothetical protein